MVKCAHTHKKKQNIVFFPFYLCSTFQYFTVHCFLLNVELSAYFKVLPTNRFLGIASTPFSSWIFSVTVLFRWCRCCWCFFSFAVFTCSKLDCIVEQSSFIKGMHGFSVCVRVCLCLCVFFIYKFYRIKFSSVTKRFSCGQMQNAIAPCKINRNCRHHLWPGTLRIVNVLKGCCCCFFFSSRSRTMGFDQ